MKNFMQRLVSIAGLVGALYASPAFAFTQTMQCPLTNATYVTAGGDVLTSGSTGLVTGTKGLGTQSLLAQGCENTSLPAVTVGQSGTAGTLNIYPATASYGVLAITDSGNSGAFNTTINQASVGQAVTYTLGDPGAATANIALTNGPAFSTTAIGNPVVHTVVGTSTVAAINAGGNTIIAGLTGHKIYVTSFDLVASGTPATCTGVYLEDSAGSPVVAATVLVAALGSGVHALPLAANTGAGFGSGGLTSADSLQLNVDGSNCTTMTAMAYEISYIVQ